MQLSLKSVIASAAIALVSTAAIAQEVVTPPSGVDIPTPSTGNGGLTFYAYDATAGTSLTVYLGLDLDSILPSAMSPEAGRSIDFGVLSGWSTAFTGGTSNVRWHVTAADSINVDDNTSVTLVGRRLATTSLAAPAVLTRNSAMNNGITNVNEFAFRVNDNANCLTGSPCVVTTPGGANAGLLENSLDGLIGGAAALNFQNTGTVGQALQFFLFSGSSAVGTQNATRAQYANSLGQAGTWNITANGHLTWTAPAAVPLPAAVWLLLSGLTGLGAVSRRRAVAA